MHFTPIPGWLTRAWWPGPRADGDTEEVQEETAGAEGSGEREETEGSTAPS